MNVKKLIESSDPQLWAKEFISAISGDPKLALDEGMMIGWFANAIQAGRNAELLKSITMDFNDGDSETAVSGWIDRGNGLEEVVFNMKPKAW